MAGFLLPPQQTIDAVAVAAHNIRDLAARVALPMAFETGVNYLKTCPGELEDGEFFASVARCADCGILLDLHNLWVNERNGRQALHEVVTSLPPERIWEIHVAGGTDLDGFALDSHAALIPDRLLADLEDLLNRLPCVCAVVFEVLPAYVARIGLDAIARQLEILRTMWDRRTLTSVAQPTPTKGTVALSDISLDRVRASEIALVSKICSDDKPADPSIALYRRLIADFRSGAVTQCLQATITLLFLTLGKERCETLMSEYLCSTDPQAFAEDEASEFCKFIASRQITVPFLHEVAAFESAVVAAARGGHAAVVEFEHDPELLFAELLQGRLPVQLQPRMTRLAIQGRDSSLGGPFDLG
jgi:hypothetical protein